VFEISKRDQADPGSIIEDIRTGDFQDIKSFLVKTRFPLASREKGTLKPYLPKLSFDSSDRCILPDKAYSPKHIYIEKDAASSALAARFKTAFPKASAAEIASLKKYISEHASSQPFDYNKRRDGLFITHENYDFFKCCPCTKNAVGCGYNIFNMGFGCIFECAYCYLQEYVNSPGIVLPSNIDSFFDKFKRYKRPGMRIGTGEFSDSLMLDHITNYSTELIRHFRGHPDIMFEFKTKSDNIKNVLNADHSGNIVIGFSLNPPSIVKANEFLTAPLSARLAATKKCASAGYKIAIHFDPVFYYPAWEKDYLAVIENIFAHVQPADIAWLSIGTFRFKPETKKIIEGRFPENTILDGELLLGYDSKLRYPYSLRRTMYRTLIDALQKHSQKLPIYLCMEGSRMWKDLRLASPFCRI